ncbi:MAG: hypothetical protein HS122_19735 [Opitutaceae bacterium]|nr:hypothetical protein [Opitutaceae bacterium]
MSWPWLALVARPRLRQIRWTRLAAVLEMPAGIEGWGMSIRGSRPGHACRERGAVRKNGAASRRGSSIRINPDHLSSRIRDDHLSSRIRDDHL